MRELLEAVAAGEVSPAAAEARLSGDATGDAGRFDAARETRLGVPKAILDDGKTPDVVASLTTTAVETTGRAIVTRTTADQQAALRERLGDDHPETNVLVHGRSDCPRCKRQC